MLPPLFQNDFLLNNDGKERFKNSVFRHSRFCGGEPQAPRGRWLPGGGRGDDARQTCRTRTPFATKRCKKICRGAGLAFNATREAERRGFRERIAQLECRPIYRDCFPHAAGSGVGHAAIGHFQPPRFFAAEIPRRCTHQLGSDERRHPYRGDHLFLETRNRHRRCDSAKVATHRAPRQCGNHSRWADDDGSRHGD